MAWNMITIVEVTLCCSMASSAKSAWRGFEGELLKWTEDLRKEVGRFRRDEQMIQPVYGEGLRVVGLQRGGKE